MRTLEVRASAWLVGCVVVHAAVKSEQFLSGKVDINAIAELGGPIPVAFEAIVGKTCLRSCALERAPANVVALHLDDAWPLGLIVFTDGR
jgi:hypothetical protein